MMNESDKSSRPVIVDTVVCISSLEHVTRDRFQFQSTIEEIWVVVIGKGLGWRSRIFIPPHDYEE